VRREKGLNVLLITIDTLRQDALGAYGNTRADTPLIDRLAREGVRFDEAHAQNVVTLPSHSNILSGRYPLQHGVHDNSGFRFPDDTPTLATILKGAGYETGAFVSAFPLDFRFGLGRGFDVYDDHFQGIDTHVAFHMQERHGSETVAAAQKWLEGRGGKPTFVWVHLYEPHFPYEPPEPYASRFKDDLYEGEVATADHALAPILEPLLGAGEKGRTLVVLTADHGESRGEHGEMTHGIMAYEATLKIPLILWSPGLLRPRTIETDVRHVDLVPTILDALDVRAPSGLPGTSLLALASGQGGSASRPPSYFEALSGSLNRGWAPLHGVIQGSRKFVDLPIPELYDLSTDPHETHNLAATDPTRLEALRNLLAGLREHEAALHRVAEDAEAREALRALGYASSATGQKAVYGVADDPKNLISLDTDIQRMLDLFQAGKVEDAIHVGEDLVRRRPGMPLVYTHLAFFYRERGDLKSAVEAARTAVRLNPDDTDAVGLLGGYLVEAGRAKEALAATDPFAKGPTPDTDVLTARGMALATLGDTKGALETFERARAIAPGNPIHLVNIGTTYLMAGDPVQAREALLAALEVGPNAKAYNTLGVIASQSGRPEEAVQDWQRAIALDPRDFQTLFNLGTTLRKLGHNAEARPFFEQYVKEAPVSEARDVEAVRVWLRSQGS
jgi:arylsulfatase A-like enzyme/Tfp pilus assembly protein PilF